MIPHQALFAWSAALMQSFPSEMPLALQTGFTHRVEHVRFTDEGRRLMTYSADGLRLWNVSQRFCERQETSRVNVLESPDTTFAHVPGERQVLDASLGRIPVQIARGQLVGAFAPGVHRALLSNGAWATDVVDTTTGASLWKPQGVPTFAPNASAATCQFAAGGAVLIGVRQYRLTAFNSATGAVLWQREAKRAKWTVSPDGSKVVVHTWNFAPQPGRLEAIDAATGRSLTTAPLPYPSVLGVRRLVVFPDGRSVALRNAAGLTLFSLERGRILRTFPLPRAAVDAFDISPDGRTIAVATDDAVQLLETQDGHPIAALGQATASPALARFLPDGALLLGQGLQLLRFAPGTLKPERVRLAPNWPTLLTRGRGWTDEPAVLDITPNGQRALVRLVRQTPVGGGFVQQVQVALCETAHGAPLRHWSGANRGAFSPTGLPTVWTARDAQATVQTESSNRRFQAQGMPNGTITIRQTRDPSAITLRQDTDVRTLSFRADGKQLASTGRDCPARVWQTDNGQEIARFVALDSGDWIISTPEGYYTASKGAARAIGFRIDGQNYPFEQFDLKLNRPDIVLERLGYADLKTIAAYRRLYQKRLKQAGVTEDQLSPDFHTPLLRIDQKALPATTRLPVATIALRALDDRQKLNRIAVSVNGVPANGVDLAGRGLSEWAGSVSVDLAPGRNRIQIWAVNDQRAESRKQTFEVYFDDKAFRPDLFVLTIGVDRYQDPKVPTLSFAAKDAGDVAAALGAGRWRKVNRLTLTNEKASRSGIEKALWEFLSPARLGDTVVVYVAGHGFVTDDYYFAPHDVRKADLSGTGLAFGALDGALGKLKARRRLLLLDTCQSGEPDKEAQGSAAPVKPAAGTQVAGRRLVTRALEPLVADPNSALGFSRSLEWMRELFSNLERGSGATVIGASSWREEAIEDSSKGYRNGLFAYALLTGLKGRAADANKDGLVSVSELRSWMERVVLAESGGRQRPTVRQENLEDDFAIR